MGKYSKKLLSRVQEYNIKKILNETGDLEEINKYLIKEGLADFIHCHHDFDNGESGLGGNRLYTCKRCGKTEMDD